MSIDIDRSEIEAAAQWAFDRAKSLGGICGADIYFSSSAGHSLSLRDGEIEENSYGVSGGISVRTIAPDGRQGVASGTKFTRAALTELIDWSRANCLASEPEQDIFLYKRKDQEDEASLDRFDERVADGISHDERMKFCLEMTGEARAADERVESVRSASWGDGAYLAMYASSEGICAWSRGTSVTYGVGVVVGSDGAFEMGGWGESLTYASDADPATCAREAVRKSVSVLGGAPLPTGRYTLILDPEIASDIVDEIGDLFRSSAIHKGRSMMKGRLGEAVASSALTLVDDARIARKLGSSTFDGEGVPTGRTTLIDRGVASAYLYNLQYAARDGAVSTGSASRGMSSLVGVSTSNLVLVPGTSGREALISGVRDGLIVRELLGLHTLDPVSGDFSLGAKGVRVVNGVEREPVSGVTIAGDLISLMKRMTAVGSDQRWFGTTAASTVIVEDVAVAGA